MYTLSPDDFALLQRIAGGFNYARVGVPVADRFAASVKWANADALNDLVQRADPSEQPAEPPAVVAPINGSVGAVSPSAAPKLFSIAPGEVVTAYAVGAGTFSWSVSSGNEPCWVSADPAFPSDEGKTGYGSGTAQIPVADGQTVYMKHDGAETKGARCSVSV